MGGEKFDTPQPEAYLFGENMDLNFFSKCPTTVSKFNYKHLSSIFVLVDLSYKLTKKVKNILLIKNMQKTNIF